MESGQDREKIEALRREIYELRKDNLDRRVEPSQNGHGRTVLLVIAGLAVVAYMSGLFDVSQTNEINQPVTEVQGAISGELVDTPCTGAWELITFRGNAFTGVNLDYMKLELSGVQQVKTGYEGDARFTFSRNAELADPQMVKWESSNPGNNSGTIPKMSGLEGQINFNCTENKLKIQNRFGDGLEFGRQKS